MLVYYLQFAILTDLFLQTPVFWDVMRISLGE
jgi:hypothetical protein